MVMQPGTTPTLNPVAFFMHAEDRDQVERALSGEPEAFEALVRKYGRMAGAIAFGVLGDYHLAQDVAQESFLKAFRSLPGLRDPSCFKTWFAGLVRRKALDALRKRHSFHLLESSPAVARSLRARASEPLPPDTEPLREESWKHTLEAIRALPQEDRLVLTLKHMDGLSYKEIAEVTGNTVSAVESRLFRARQALKKLLDPTRT